MRCQIIMHPFAVRSPRSTRSATAAPNAGTYEGPRRINQTIKRHLLAPPSPRSKLPCTVLTRRRRSLLKVPPLTRRKPLCDPRSEKPTPGDVTA